ncbi:MAG TPA: peptidoglycan DD-metalloendopeptidase family protein [Nocardioides sp.]|nr:peptidoglycan DD-metalloendopeptidase family protein [Nocardioides sp.]
MASALLACGLLLGSAAVPAANAGEKKPSAPATDQDALAKKKDEELVEHDAELQRKMAGVHVDLEHSSAQLRAAAAALSMAQSQLATAQDKLARTRGELAAAKALDRQMQLELEAAVRRLDKARADLDAGRVEVAEQERELGMIVVSNYQSGDPSLMGLSMLLTTQDPAELTGQLNSVQNIIDKEAVTLSRLEASKVLLTVQEQEFEDAREEVAERRRAAAKNLERKKDLERAAVAVAQRVSNLVSLRANAQREAEEARAADMATLQSLEDERERIAEVLAERAKIARREAEAAAAAASGYGAGVSNVKSNGFLDFPVPGRITSPYGIRRHPIFGYTSLHDGIDFAGGCGTPIYAASRGVVVEMYFNKAYGNRILIDHGLVKGVSLATISNHLSGYAVAVGDHVKRGDIIGFVGNTGWSTGCHLHFTVLVNGGHVDPMGWL